MKIRRATVNDFNEIKKLHKSLEQQFAFPDMQFASSVCVIVDDEDKIIAVGILHPIFESTVFLDKQESRADRLEALQLLINQAEYELKSQGIDQYHAFVQDKSFFNLLKKRFGFKATKGSALVRLLNG